MHHPSCRWPVKTTCAHQRGWLPRLRTRQGFTIEREILRRAGLGPAGAAGHQRQTIDSLLKL